MPPHEENEFLSEAGAQPQTLLLTEAEVNGDDGQDAEGYTFVLDD